MDVKKVMRGNWIQNAAHRALLLIHSKITPALRKQLEECASMDRSDADFFYLRTKTHEPVRMEDNPDKTGGKQQSTLDMLRSMAACSTAGNQPTPTNTALAAPTATHDPNQMDSSSSRIPRL